MDQMFFFLADDLYVSGVNTSGTVRVNMLSNLEALLNIFANSVEVISIAVGLVFLVIGLKIHYSDFDQRNKIKTRAWVRTGLGALLIKVGLVTPFVVNWMVASARDAALFN